MIKGIYPPLATPFDDDGEISFKGLKSNIERYNNINLSGYVLFGSNGESVYLTREEKLSLITEAREHISENKLLIAGTGSESIKETIYLSNEAAKLGADFALIITPFFFQKAMNHEALINYFTVVADNSNIPIIIYNVTKFTNVNIESDTVAQLAEHKNISGLKNSTENVEQILETIKKVPKDFSVLAGTGSVLLPALKEGCSGGVLALANIAAQQCVNIFDLFTSGKIEETELLQEKIIPVNKAITSEFGVPGLKKALDILGYYGGKPRIPLQPLNENDTEKLKIVLINAELLN